MSTHTLRPLLSMAAIVVSVTASIDCTSDRDGFQNENLDAGAAPSGPFVPPDADVSDSGTFNPDEACQGETQLIYVLTNIATVYRFDPRTLTFTELGMLRCPSLNWTESMGVDRYGNAWVGSNDGRVFKARLDSLEECTEVTMRWPDPGGTWIPAPTSFGMAFSKDESETGESLFMGGRGLWKMDPKKYGVEHVGENPPMFNTLFELTGTGDGKLYGYDNQNGIVAWLDPATGNVLETHRTTSVAIGAWAFAQWGGDFWLFSSNVYGPNTTVTRYNPVTRTSTVVVEDAGIQILGAGSSTCAPYEPPK